MPTETILDRQTMPAIAANTKIEIINAQKTTFSNGVPVYYVDAGTQDVIKAEVIIRAGTREQDIPLTASTANSMLEYGTVKHSAEEIASLLDYYGSFLETSVNHDYALVTLYTLGKHLDEVLPLFRELLYEPSFPQNELDIFLINNKQRFIVDEQKVRVVAARNFPEILFGAVHPYGKKAEADDYDRIKRENIESFHTKLYSQGSYTLIVSGNIKGHTLAAIEENFGKDIKTKTNPEKQINYTPSPAAEKKKFIAKKDVTQNAIRLGKTLFLKNHPDAIPFQILNTVFGGYFGSRLMTNIREDKGYTYGISSGVVFLQHAGYFTIASEVGSDVCTKALEEIYNEIDILCTKPIPENELQLVKNYLRGSFMRSMDGPFAMAERFKQLLLHNMDYSYYESYLNAVNNITSSELKNIAEKYLQMESIYELVVGADS
jgi:zinc protease